MVNIGDIADSLDSQAEQKQAQADKTASSAEAAQNTGKIVEAVDKSAQATADGLKSIKGEVKVTNPADMNGVVDSINKLNLTTFMQNEGLPQLAKNLSDLSGKTQDLQDKLENEGLKKMSDQLGLVVKKLDEVSKTLSKTEVSVDTKLQRTIDNLSKSINAIDFKPAVNVTAPQPKVVTTPVDLKPLLNSLASLEQAVKDSEAPETEIDLTSVTSGLSAVQSAITALRFPVPNYVLPFRGIDGKATQMQLDAAGNLPTDAGSATPYGGYTPGKLVSAATTNATSVKTSAGTIGYVTASNVNAAARYLKLYNKASAPTVGSDVPVHTFIIPGNTAGAGSNIPLPAQGISFPIGIAFALTVEATDAGSTGVALSEIVINYGYV